MHTQIFKLNTSYSHVSLLIMPCLKPGGCALRSHRKRQPNDRPRCDRLRLAINLKQPWRCPEEAGDALKSLESGDATDT